MAGRTTWRDDAFRADALLVRARRFAGLSQRELARRTGVAKSTVASVESGARQPSLQLLDRLLCASGLRLAVVDAHGAALTPFPDDAIRDNGGRRFPAHLDVLPPGRIPPARIASPRYDRGSAKGWYHLQEDARSGVAETRGRPSRGGGAHARRRRRRRRRLGGCSTPLVALTSP